MRIFAVGATGFIGRSLVPALVDRGHEVTVLARGTVPFPPHPRIHVLSGNPMQAGPWQQAVADHEAVINLAGASIATRWTQEAKKRILDSRVVSTRNLVAALAGLPPKTLVCANAVGYFGDSGDALLDDDAPAGKGFLAEVAAAWQDAALEATAHGHRGVITRFGVVLGPGGGALAQMLPIFRLGLGGRLGSGQQWFPWVHIRDVVDAIAFALEHPHVQGPINVVAPETVTNAQFTAALGKTLGRPTLLPVPAWVLRLVLGEAAAMLLSSLRCVPKRLMEWDFCFSYPDVATALRHATQA
jgi:uncharacterized protein (TIGR01777 family)